MNRLLFISMLIFLHIGELYSQTIMVVDLINGVEQNVELTIGSCITFPEDSIVVTTRTESYFASSYAISDVRKLSFHESIITDVNSVEQSSIHVYPNPVADYLTIVGIGKRDLPLTVFSLDGSVVIRGHYRYGSRVIVSSLAPGPYLIQVGSYNCKFVKK